MAGRKGHKGQIKADVAERQRKAFEYRKAGASFYAIGRQLGISHEQARLDVNAVIASLNAESKELAAEYRATQLERLDAMLLPLWPIVTGDSGRDKPIAMETRLQAIDRVLKIETRRAKLLGLDAPTKMENSGDPDNPVTVRIVWGRADGER